MSDKFDIVFREIGRKSRVPAGLLKAVAIAESGLDPKARRREVHLDDESRGLMQILVGTARDPLGEKDPEALWNPIRNVELGAAYLKMMYSKFGEIPNAVATDTPDDERWMFAVCAYNAGRGSANRALVAARQSLGMGGALSTAIPGPWTDWGFTSAHLSGITGLRNADITNRHVAKVRALWWREDQLGTFS